MRASILCFVWRVSFLCALAIVTSGDIVASLKQKTLRWCSFTNIILLRAICQSDLGFSPLTRADIFAIMLSITCYR
jgi:hypothetical protein